MRRLSVILLVALLLCGCGAKDTAADTTEAAKQATVVEKIISNDTLVDLIRLELAYNADADRAQYLDTLEQLAQITVTEYTLEGDTITATVSVTAPNMYAIAKTMENEPFTDAATVDAAVCAKLEASEDMITKSCTLTFRQVEEVWSVVFTEEFNDALYGGLITYRNEYLASLEVQ